MLQAHFEALEKQLLQSSRIAANAGHPVHKGTAREAFVKEFLETHLSERVAIGTGEIIDANSRPGQQRNQMDIVIHRRDFPRLRFGGGITGFLIESVAATVEVKSTLDKEGLRTSMIAARNAKALTPSLVQSFHAGYKPPGVLSYLVSYDGPGQMETVYNWLSEIVQHDGMALPTLPLDDEQRLAAACPTLDAIIILGKGFVHFGNAPVGFFDRETLNKNPNARWIAADSPTGNLLLLFVLLTQAVSGLSGSWLNPLPYLTSYKVSRALLGP